MVSSPYLICTPRIGNSKDGCYFVKFGDSSKPADVRIDGYNTYLPEPNRTSSQLTERNDYKIDGKMLQYQIFDATNQSLRPKRQAFTKVSTTEWYKVWPKDEDGNPDSDPLEAVLHFFDSNDQVAKAKLPMPQNQVHPFIEWLHVAIPSGWRTEN